MSKASPAQQIALWADKLRDLSALGLRFADNPYDTDHYQTVQEIAMAMLSLATDTPLHQMEPAHSADHRRRCCHRRPRPDPADPPRRQRSVGHARRST